MRGYELNQARKLMRTELRRAAQNDLPTGMALDVPYLFDLLAGGPGNARCNVLTRTLVVRQLRAMGLGADVIAQRYGMQPAQLAHELERPILEDSAVAAGIADQVLEALRETAEPGRVQAPTGDRVVPGESYIPDPHSQYSGR